MGYFFPNPPIPETDVSPPFNVGLIFFKGMALMFFAVTQ